MSSMELIPTPSLRHQRLSDTRDGVLVMRPAPRKVKLGSAAAGQVGYETVLLTESCTARVMRT
eukprot:36744-Eustigmatos_ZCMA.PRE.1